MPCRLFLFHRFITLVVLFDSDPRRGQSKMGQAHVRKTRNLLRNFYSAVFETLVTVSPISTADTAGIDSLFAIV